MTTSPQRAAAAALFVSATALLTPGVAAAGHGIPRLDLSRVDPAVRAQLEDARDSVDALPEGAVGERAAAALGRLGRLYLAYDYLEPGTASLEAAETAKPDNFAWPYLLGYAYHRQGRFDASIEAFERSLEIEPGSPVANLRLGNQHLAEARLEEAGSRYRLAYAAEPTCLGAVYGLGEIARRQGDDEVAVRYFQEALSRDPEATQPRYALGLALRRLGRMDEARAALRQARWQTMTFGGWLGCADPLVDEMAAATTGAPAHLLRGARATIHGNNALEIAEYSKAVEANSDDDAARSNLAAALYRSGELEGAARHYRAAIEIHPDNATYVYDLGIIEQRRGRPEEARDLFRRSVELDPRFKRGYLKLAETALEAGRFEDVVEHCRAVVAIDPLHRHARAQIGAALLRLGRREEAMAELGNLLDVDPPQNPVERIQLASQLAMLGDLDRALRHFDDVAEHARESRVRAIAESRAGQTLLQQGHVEQSIERLETALELDPGLGEARSALQAARAEATP